VFGWGFEDSEFEIDMFTISYYGTTDMIHVSHGDVIY
jgi:hypothetical protein